MLCAVPVGHGGFSVDCEGDPEEAERLAGDADGAESPVGPAVFDLGVEGFGAAALPADDASVRVALRDGRRFSARLSFRTLPRKIVDVAQWRKRTKRLPTADRKQYRVGREEPELWDDFEWLAGFARDHPWTQSTSWQVRTRARLGNWIGGLDRPR